MAVIFRIALLVVVAIVVQAIEDFEYSADIVDSLDDYRRLQDKAAESLNYRFADRNTVLLERGLNYPGMFFIASNQEVKPVIIVSSKENPKGNHYYLREMLFNVLHSKNNKPYLELSVKFHDPNTKLTIEVVMYAFKPPSKKINEEHQIQHEVPVLPSPIPVDVLPSLVENFAGKQEFETDIAWMEKALKRALYWQTTPDHFFGLRTEVFLAGPVIIDLDEFNQILRMDHFYRRYVPDLLSLL